MMLLTFSCLLISPASQRKSKLHFLSRHEMLSQILGQHMHIYCILGMFRGVISAMASLCIVEPNSFSSRSISAALVMYQQAQKLAMSIVDVVSFVETAQAQLEAIMVAINALSLVDSKNAWIVAPRSPATTVSRLP